MNFITRLHAWPIVFHIIGIATINNYGNSMPGSLFFDAAIFNFLTEVATIDRIIGDFVFNVVGFQDDMFYIDEIGKMECLSRVFVEAVDDRPHGEGLLRRCVGEVPHVR